jgi:uncharacterized protein
MPTPASPLRFDVADLLRRPSARRPVTADAALDDVGTSAARVEGPVHADVMLERIPDGIVVRGTVSADWVASCSTCLREVRSTIEAGVDELFETEPVEGETYPIEGHEIDLEQLVRDSVLLELPLAPHCAEPCEPELPTDTDDTPDPRWAALSELEL